MKFNLKLLLILCLLAAISFGSAIAGKRHTEIAFLGVHLQTIDDDLADDWDLPVEHGVIINEVEEESAAEKAGLEEDDIIVAIDGRKIWDSSTLSRRLDRYDPGEEVTVTYYRGQSDEKKEVQVTLGSKKVRRDRNYSSYRGNYGKLLQTFYDDDDNDHRIIIGGFGDRPYLGITMSNLSEQLADYFGVDDDEGVLVTEVHDDSPAEDAGIKAGDVIVKIDDEEVEDTDDITDIIHDYDEGDEIEIEIIRHNDRKTITVELDEWDYDNDFGNHYNIAAGHYIEALEELEDLEIHSLHDLGKLGKLGKLGELQALRGLPRIQIHDDHGVRYSYSYDDDFDFDFDFDDFDFDFDFDDLEVDMEDLEVDLRQMQRELRHLEEGLY